MTSKEFVEKWAALLDATLDPYCVEHEVEMLADLDAHRASVLEEAAKVSDVVGQVSIEHGEPVMAALADGISQRIRALRVKP